MLNPWLLRIIASVVLGWTLWSASLLIWEDYFRSLAIFSLILKLIFLVILPILATSFPIVTKALLVIEHADADLILGSSGALTGIFDRRYRRKEATC